MEHDDGGHLVLFDLEILVAGHEDLGKGHGGEGAGLDGAEGRIEAGRVVFLAFDFFEFLEVCVEIARVFELVVVLDEEIGVFLGEFGDGLRHAVACAAAGVELDQKVHGGHMAFVGGLDHVFEGFFEIAALVVRAAGAVADGKRVEPVGILGMGIEFERPDHAGVFAAAGLAEIILDGEEVSRVRGHVETLEVVGLGSLVVLFRADFAVFEFLCLQVDVFGGPAHLDVLADDVACAGEVVREDHELEEIVGVVLFFRVAKHAFRRRFARFGGGEGEVVVCVALFFVDRDEVLSEGVDVAEVDGGVQIAVFDREIVEFEGLLVFLREDLSGEGVAGQEVCRDGVAGARLALQEFREVVDLARAAEHADDLGNAVLVFREDVEELEHRGVLIRLEPDGVDALHENAGERQPRLFVLDGREEIVTEGEVEIGLHALAVFIAFADEGMHLEILFGGEFLGRRKLRKFEQILERGLLPGAESALTGEARGREMVACGDAAEFGGAAEVALRVAVVVGLAGMELAALGEFVETEGRVCVASGFLGDEGRVFGPLGIESRSEQCGAADGCHFLFHGHTSRCYAFTWSPLDLR